MASETKNCPGSIFVGRDELMDWLERTILPENLQERKQHCPLVLLYGSSGTGKTAACRQFVKMHLARDRNAQPFFAFNWKGGVQGRSVVRFSRLLFRMGVANMPLDGNNQNLLMIDVSEEGDGDRVNQPADGASELTHPDQTYREDGVAEDVLEVPQRLSDADQESLAREFASRLLDWMGKSLEDPSTRLLGKIVFIFDDFEDHHVAIRRWVGRYLYPALNAVEALPGCAYLFTARQSWDQCSFADYWELSPGSLKQYQLSALDPTDCKKWLKAAGLQEEYLEVLVEETEGIPGKIAPLIERPGLLDSLSQGLAEDSPLRPFDARERRWLHAASMQSSVALEAFELLIGRSEAVEALAWLREHPEVCRVVPGKGGQATIEVEAKIRSAALKRAEKKIPMRHQEYADRLALMRQLNEKVPLRLHRRYLELLAPVEPLNEEAIRYVHGENR